MSGNADPVEVRRAVALVASAIRAHDEDEAEDRAHFLSSAARGRPAVSEETGRSVVLRASGPPCPIRVHRAGPSTYRVETGGGLVQAEVGRLAGLVSRLDCPAGTFAIGWGPPGAPTVEVDGHWFTVGRDDRGLVRAPVPAVVAAVLVERGQSVAEGDPLVVVEAMKMEMSIRAPHPGWVRTISVTPNTQVDAGDPLVQLVPAEQPAPSVEGPASLEPLQPPAAPARDRFDECAANLDELRHLALGFDVDPSVALAFGAFWDGHCASTDARAGQILAREQEVLETVADVCALSRRIVESDDDGVESMHLHEEDFLTYLRYLDASHPALSPAFVESLRRALGHHGVTSLDRSPELEEAVYRLFRSHLRIEQQVPAVQAILDARLDRIDTEGPGAAPSPSFRDVLDRLADAAHGRHPALSDLAREARYRFFDQPVLEEVRRTVYAEVEADLARLEANPARPDREDLIRSLVACPQPLKRMLIQRLRFAPPAVRAPMIEALARRYYRIRDLGEIACDVEGDRPVVTATYPHEGTTVHVAATCGPRSELSDAVAALARAVQGIPDGHDAVLDVYLWREEPPADPDRTAAEIAAALDSAAFDRPPRRVVVALSGPGPLLKSVALEHFTFRPSPDGFREEILYRGLHPMMGKRLDLWRLANFTIDRLPSVEDVYLFHGVAKDNPKDERLFALTEVRDLTPVRDAGGRLVALPALELMITEALEAIRLYQSHRPSGRRLQWNRVMVSIWPTVDLSTEELFGIVHKLAPQAEGLGLEKVVVRARLRDRDTGKAPDRVIHISNPAGKGLALRFDSPADRPIRPLSEYMQKVVQTRQRGLTYPYELVKMLTPDPGVPADIPPGRFRELDLDPSGHLVPVDRPYGENQANVVVGIMESFTDAYPEGMARVAILGDPSRSLGSLAEPECRRIVAALDLAERMGVPLEWFAVSAGAKISMSSGTENMDWIGRVLRRLIEFTQAGGEVNVVVCGINVGAQPYWNAEATMLMHTRGILVMTPDGATVLTGKQALDYSGGVSAEDNVGIGGYDRVMGPNGQAQYWASDLHEACRVLLRHYDHAYVRPGERFPRRVPTTDAFDRDVGDAPHRPDGDAGFRTVGDVFSEATNPGRKKPFHIRSVMRAAIDRDRPPLERWGGMEDAEIAVVWDAHLGGRPVCLIGIESRPLPRREVGPADGPEHWTSGTLFPLSSKKIARAVNAASGNRPLVVLANLSGFDGSPESLRRLQLEYGAEIGRAVVNFRGPMVFCVVSRYHGGAFVVFSKTLNERMEVAAVEGSFASVIGGAPAAAVVFARDVDQRTLSDPRVASIAERLASAGSQERPELRRLLEEATATVRSEKLGEVAAEFDRIHTIYRAKEMGSVDRIIRASDLRPYLIDAVERGIRRVLDDLGTIDLRSGDPDVDLAVAAFSTSMPVGEPRP